MDVMNIKVAAWLGRGAAVLMLPGALDAQPIVNGPPIDPGMAIQAQPRPSTTLPPPQVTAPGAPRPPVTSAPIPQGRLVQDRATWCHHMAGVERVPKKRRGAYIHNCLRAD
jgi:hypothetical protein